MQKKHSLASLAILALSFMYTGQASAQGAWPDMGDTIIVDKNELMDVLRRVAASNKRTPYRSHRGTTPYTSGTTSYRYDRGYQPGSTVPVYNTVSRQVERIPVYVPQGAGMNPYLPYNNLQNPQEERARRDEYQQTLRLQEEIDQLQEQLKNLGQNVQDPAVKHQLDSMANHLNTLHKRQASSLEKPLVENETERMEQPQVDEQAKSITTTPFETNIRQVFFEISSDKLTNEAKQTLKAVADLLVDNRDLKVKLTGHASKDGPDAFNQNLAKRRMQSVKSNLLRHGVKANQMSTLSSNIDTKSDLSTYARRVDLCISL